MNGVTVAILCAAFAAGGLMIGFFIGYGLGREEGYDEATRQHLGRDDRWAM